tara:strand:- start:215 stop:802 length:588 start_codon:yes stop_codon:yes gene_type:complete
MKYIKSYLNDVSKISKNIDKKKLMEIIELISLIKKNNGNLFFLGAGGSAGNASHAVNDFRKLANISSFSPTDNISELTARVNDEGWNNFYVDWLKVINLKKEDLIAIFSVGGGDINRNVSVGLVNAVKYAKKRGIKTISFTSNKKGFCYKNCDVSIFIPYFNKKRITPYSESFQSILWHLIVTHPMIKQNKMKWE